MHEGQFRGGRTVLYLVFGSVYLAVCVYANSYKCIPKRVNFSICKLYLNVLKKLKWGIRWNKHKMDNCWSWVMSSWRHINNIYPLVLHTLSMKISAVKSKNNSINKANVLAWQFPLTTMPFLGLLSQQNFLKDLTPDTISTSSPSVQAFVPSIPWSHVKVLVKITNDLLTFT